MSGDRTRVRGEDGRFLAATTGDGGGALGEGDDAEAAALRRVLCAVACGGFDRID